MAKVNVDILGISELKWTGMGEYNSDDHYIYYCGQESLKRNGVDIVVNKRVWNAVQFSSVTQSCPTLCDPMNRSTPGLPVHHHLMEFTQTHVHRVRDAIQPSHPLLSPSPPAPIPLSIRVFSNESTLRMRWPKYWSFSFSIIPSKEIPGLISFRMDWLDLLLGCNLKNDRMNSVHFQGKPFNITVIQVYAPTSNTEEAELNGSMKTYKTF